MSAGSGGGRRKGWVGSFGAGFTQAPSGRGENATLPTSLLPVPSLLPRRVADLSRGCQPGAGTYMEPVNLFPPPPRAQGASGFQDPGEV